MAKFIVTETRTVTKILTYEVEAENGNQALMEIFDCKVDPVEVSHIENEDDSAFEVERIED